MKTKVNASRMGKDPIFSLLLSMAIPGLLGALTTYFYRTVDQIFVGNFVGRNALGGISVLAPYNNIVIALTLFLTVGGASLISLSMGSREYEKANKLFTNIILQAILMASVVTTIIFVFAEPFVDLCGAKHGTEVSRYAVSYLRIVVLGQVFVMLNLGLAAIIRSEGGAKYSMIANMVGAVCNIILDAVLIVVFDMGIEGAAIATISSQFLGALYSATYFLRGKSNLKWMGIKVVDINQMFHIAKMGVAPSIFQVLAFFANIVLNKSLQHYGDLDPAYSLLGGGQLCISAIAIVNTVDQFILSSTMGVNQGVAPILGYNYGAKQYDRVKKATLMSQGMAFSMAIVIWGFMMATPEFVVNLFSNGDKALIEYGAMAMRTCKIFALFSGYQMLISMYFSAIGKPHIATLVSLSRNGIFLIPALLILPKFFGLKGVLYANAVSDGCSLLIVSGMYFYEMKRLGVLQNKTKNEKTNFELANS